MFAEGVQGPAKNPGLRFQDTTQGDLRDPNAPYLPEGNPGMALHTQKSIRIHYPKDYYWDPQAEEIFFRLAECFIRIKNRESIRQSFHDFAEEIGLILQPKRKERRKKSARYFWWRRQQRRFRR
jgi:hypothetical protein